MLSDGDPAPDVVLDTSENRSVRLSSLRGQKLSGEGDEGPR